MSVPGYTVSISREQLVLDGEDEALQIVCFSFCYRALATL